jgi:hypothetical protein
VSLSCPCERGGRSAPTRSPPLRGRIPVAIPLLARFTAGGLRESSPIALPAALAPVWQGGGGRTSERTTAALTRQVRLERRTGRLDVQLQDGRAADQAAEFPGQREAGALPMAALGSWSRDACRPLTPQGICWRSRLQVQTALDTGTGQRQGLLARLTAQPAATLDMAVTLGETPHLPARLLAGRVPQDGATARRRRWRAAARTKGRQASATPRALAAWTRLVTQVPGDRWTRREALVWARVRWPIARRCNWWKSHGRVDESRRTTPWRLRCAVDAKLRARLAQQWVCLVRCGASPQRRRVQAAQTGQKPALPLARPFGRLRRVLTALSTVQRWVAAGGRLHRRKKPPNTDQLVCNDLSMTTAFA